MKKLFVSVVLCVLIVCIVFSTNAQSIDVVTPYWLNTLKLYMDHDWLQGDADCVIEIVGKQGTTLIDNIDIAFLQEDYNGGWIELARWDDLSVIGDWFIWNEVVDDTPYGYTYRLTLSFDIHRNGTVEHIEDYFDRLY